MTSETGSAIKAKREAKVVFKQKNKAVVTYEESKVAVAPTGKYLYISIWLFYDLLDMT